MPIEPNTLQQILKLSPQDMFDLVETVGTAVQVNIPLIALPKDKIEIACLMLDRANKILEQCGGEINIIIGNKTWIRDIRYKTGSGYMEEIV